MFWVGDLFCDFGFAFVACGEVGGLVFISRVSWVTVDVFSAVCMGCGLVCFYDFGLCFGGWWFLVRLRWTCLFRVVLWVWYFLVFVYWVGCCFV